MKKYKVLRNKDIMGFGPSIVLYDTGAVTFSGIVTFVGTTDVPVLLVGQCRVCRLCLVILISTQHPCQQILHQIRCWWPCHSIANGHELCSNYLCTSEHSVNLVMGIFSTGVVVGHWSFQLQLQQLQPPGQ